MLRKTLGCCSLCWLSVGMGADDVVSRGMAARSVGKASEIRETIVERKVFEVIAYVGDADGANGSRLCCLFRAG